MPELECRDAIAPAVLDAVRRAPVVDLHTHIYDAGFGDLLLRGPDELLSYHYMTAELFRRDPRLPDGAPLTPEDYYRLGKPERAAWAWKALFAERAPLSEAARGVVTSLSGLADGARVERDLETVRARFAGWTAEEHINRVFAAAGVVTAVMTNDPFDDAERAIWEKGGARDNRFLAALRLDPLLVDWPTAAARLRSWGFAASDDAGDAAGLAETRRFLLHWIDAMKPVYLAASTGHDFDPYARPDQQAVFHQAILPVCAERNLPVALMIGTDRQINPRLILAGDGVKQADLTPLTRLCRDYPEQRFLATLLSRENQHELCVIARKFGNLLPFGCWWFLNDPMTIDEMTRMRLELLGPTFCPQHSDARVLDQLVYKWTHSRKLIAAVLREKFEDLWDAGWRVDADEIEQTARDLFADNFLRFVGRA